MLVLGADEQATAALGPENDLFAYPPISPNRFRPGRPGPALPLPLGQIRA